MLARVALCSVLSGCSVVTMSGPPAAPVTRAPACESARVVPALDAVLAAAAVVGGSLMLREQLAEDGPPTTGLAIALGGGIAFTMSSVIGFRRARACRRARDEWRSAAVTARNPTAVPVAGAPADPARRDRGE